MSQNKKINRRNSKKGIFKIIFLVLLLLLFLAAGLFAYFYFSNRSYFISPLPSNYILGSGSDRDEKTFLLQKLLREKNIEYSKISSSNNYIVLEMKDKSKIIFSSNKDLPTQIASLQFILTRLTMESKGFKELDLRFDKPVIRQ